MKLSKHVEKTPIKFESSCVPQKFICEYNLPREGQWLLVYWAFLVKEHYRGCHPSHSAPDLTNVSDARRGLDGWTPSHGLKSSHHTGRQL